MTLFRKPARFNSVTRIGNVLKALLLCQIGHDFKASEPEWYHDGSGSQEHECLQCGRVESKDTLGPGDPGLRAGTMTYACR